MIINILGNGPSLKKYSWKRDITTIGTNWILNHKKFFELSDNYYVVYDERFLFEKKNNWIGLLKKINYQKIYVPKQWINYNLVYKKFNALEDMKKKNVLIDMYFDKFYNKVDNVIFKCAIPLALYLKSDKIRLYGCDFDYDIKDDETLNDFSYFYDKENHKTEFKHTINSAKEWSIKSKETFNLIKEYLEKYSIIIENKS
tara:strand:+ start:60 stop:659 length:600 start_codon:yes stop_codon:yes gene_type:complete